MSGLKSPGCCSWGICLNYHYLVTHGFRSKIPARP
nr:MAG TPA: hypothetical protein [Caudoviricetes sp.]